MKSPKTTDQKGRVTLHLLLGTALGLMPLVLLAQGPQWWANRGVKVPTATANDYAAVNQGQLKNMTVKAVAELNAYLPGGAGSTLNALSGQLSGTSVHTNDYAAVNLGQLKAVAKPFYDRLKDAGYPVSYPWVGREPSSNDYAMANIGQVKNLFNFNVTLSPTAIDTAHNGLPDDWEIQCFGSAGVVQASGIDSANGVTYLQDYLQGRTPNKGAVSDIGGTAVALEVFSRLE